MVRNRGDDDCLHFFNIGSDMFSGRNQRSPTLLLKVNVNSELPIPSPIQGTGFKRKDNVMLKGDGCQKFPMTCRGMDGVISEQL